MPIGMCKRGVEVSPVSGSIDDDHKSDGHAPQDIQRQIAIVEDFGLVVNGHRRVAGMEMVNRNLIIDRKYELYKNKVFIQFKKLPVVVL